MEISFGLIFSSFAAGLFTFFAPCTLPLVPAFLGVISGTHTDNTRDVRGKVFLNALFYVIGFSAIFILFGVAFSLVGQISLIRNIIQQVGGILIIIFGLIILGIFKIDFLSGDHRIRVPKLFKSASLLNSFLIGALFAFGWSPCIGPLLGTILFLASSSGTVVSGTFLLVIFSLGLGIPFLVTALFVGRAMEKFQKWEKVLKVINIIAGIFLIWIGILLLTNHFNDFFGLITSYFVKFGFYEEFILKYL